MYKATSRVKHLYKLYLDLTICQGAIRIAVLDETILGNLDPYAKPISPPCKGGRGDSETVSFGIRFKRTWDGDLRVWYHPLSRGFMRCG